MGPVGTAIDNIGLNELHLAKYSWSEYLRKNKDIRLAHHYLLKWFRSGSLTVCIAFVSASAWYKSSTGEAPSTEPLSSPSGAPRKRDVRQDTPHSCIGFKALVRGICQACRCTLILRLRKALHERLLAANGSDEINLLWVVPSTTGNMYA